MKLILFFFAFVNLAYSDTNGLSPLKNTKVEAQNTFLSEVKKEDVTLKNANSNINFEKKNTVNPYTKDK